MSGTLYFMILSQHWKLETVCPVGIDIFDDTLECYLLWVYGLIYFNLYFIDTMVCTGCCASLDHIVTYLFKQMNQKGMHCCLSITELANILFNID